MGPNLSKFYTFNPFEGVLNNFSKIPKVTFFSFLDLIFQNPVENPGKNNFFFKAGHPTAGSVMTSRVWRT